MNIETRQSLIDMNTMFKLQTLSSSVRDRTSPDAQRLVYKGGEIRFENVSFGYDEARPLVKDLSLIVPAGSRVAFVGPSGQTPFSLTFFFGSPL
jgi:ATP-binding cassette, subfamily B (MDR/TAP), member 7